MDVIEGYGTPILYTATVPVRFSDIDRYQHVQTTAYVEYVYAARFEFLRQRFNLPSSYFEQNDMGLFTTRFEVFFEKPIPSDQPSVFVASHISAVEGARFTINYEVLKEQGSMRHARGSFDCFVIQLSNQKPYKQLPQQILPLAFEPEGVNA